MQKTFIFFTCEHASNAIPSQYKHLFIRFANILSSHRGFDQGTKYLGQAFGKSLKAPVVYGKFSRLLIDLNRSPSHKSAFSEMTKTLSSDQRFEIKAKYHRPHWEKIEKIIDEKMAKGFTVLHIGVHSFTPVLYNEVRNADIGILYDSRRKKETSLAISWQKSLRNNSELRVRRNYPYLGMNDGLTTELRERYSENKYIGIEIEVNHALLKKPEQIKMIGKLLIKSLKENLP
ncbi:MAG: N-formylglutamate amidohydrolase [Bacteriovorax sp.]|nr:N-formylglutamate amidohydrolase [Bacteriovorax sp.]